MWITVEPYTIVEQLNRVDLDAQIAYNDEQMFALSETQYSGSMVRFYCSACVSGSVHVAAADQQIGNGNA